jgi:hypothetical protein
VQDNAPTEAERLRQLAAWWRCYSKISADPAGYLLLAEYVEQLADEVEKITPP